MKITTNDGMVFECTQAEYDAFLAFAERNVAEQKADETPYVPQEGDIVRLLDDSDGGLRGFNGIVTKIIEDDGSCVPYLLEKPTFIDTEANTWYMAESIELIAPVESTFK